MTSITDAPENPLPFSRSRPPNSSVMMVEVIDENRLARSHRVTGFASHPVRGRLVERVACGTSNVVATAQRSTSAMRALYQFMNRLMPRLMVRNTAMISAIASIA